MLDIDGAPRLRSAWNWLMKILADNLSADATYHRVDEETIEYGVATPDGRASLKWGRRKNGTNIATELFFIFERSDNSMQIILYCVGSSWSCKHEPAQQNSDGHRRQVAVTEDFVTWLEAHPESSSLSLFAREKYVLHILQLFQRLWIDAIVRMPTVLNPKI